MSNMYIRMTLMSKNMFNKKQGNFYRKHGKIRNVSGCDIIQNWDKLMIPYVFNFSNSQSWNTIDIYIFWYFYFYLSIYLYTYISINTCCILNILKQRYKIIHLSFLDTKDLYFFQIVWFLNTLFIHQRF